jgi:hypothetical protein
MIGGDRGKLCGVKSFGFATAVLLLLTTFLPSGTMAQNLRRRATATPATSAAKPMPSDRDAHNQPEAVTLAVAAPVFNTTPGANMTIPIMVGDTTGLNIVAYVFDLVYDPAVITPQANPILTTGTLSANLLPTFNPISPGLLKVVFFGANPTVGSGVLFKFRFTAVGPIGSSSPLTWVGFKWDEGTPIASATPGQVNIVGPTATNASLAGRVLTASGQAVGYARVSLIARSGETRTAISSPFGYFQFEGIPTGHTVVLRVAARGLSFPDQVVNIDGNIADLTVTADP